MGESETPLPAPLSPWGFLRLGAWLGLLAGFGELAAFVLVRGASGEVWPDFGKSRQYPWAIPAADALLLTACAVPLAALAAVLPRVAGRIGPRVLLTLAMLPGAFAAGTSLHPWALLALATGASAIVGPPAKRHEAAVRSVARRSVVPMLLALAGLAAWCNVRGGPDRTAGASAASPNVLLIVLDTVRDDAVGLEPGRGPVTPNLAALASGGVTFTNARSTAPWTLPSHASMMTGRWPHEVAVGRYGAMDGEVPTLAEELGGRGFDTVGIVANTYFCSYFTGLDRGFDRFEDIPETPLSLLSCSEFGGRLADRIARLWARVAPDAPRLAPRGRRKDADEVNRRFLDWLDRRPPGRPFFAFLNYFDAHDPYIVPDRDGLPPGTPPSSPGERTFFEDYWLLPKDGVTAEQVARLREGYDACIAYLDDRLGRLSRELERRGVLDETIVVVTSDHGEAFGEHGLFGHGGSLFEDQLRVPLLIRAPGRVPEGMAVGDPVSLADLPATILDLLGDGRDALPGASLARLWGAGDGPGRPAVSPPFALVDGPEAFPPNHGRSPVAGGPMLSVMGDDAYKYIVSFGAGAMAREQLFDLAADPGERFDLSWREEGRLWAFRAIVSDLLGGRAPLPWGAIGGPAPEVGGTADRGDARSRRRRRPRTGRAPGRSRASPRRSPGRAP